MSLELPVQNLADVFLELEWMTDQPLDVALVHEQPPLLLGTASGRHLVEQERGARVHALGHDLQAGQVGHHDQVPLESLRELLGQLTQRGLYGFFEARV